MCKYNRNAREEKKKTKNFVSYVNKSIKIISKT